MTITVSEAGKLGAKRRNERLSPKRRLEISKLANARKAEIRAANKKALDALNAKVEGKK